MNDSHQTVKVELGRDHPTFKREGDQLVPLEGRDPQRRYGLVIDGSVGGPYFVEFTDEEELEADRREVEWEKSAPEREAIAKEQAEAAEKFANALRYKVRIVAFLDILGWKSAVLSKDEEGSSVVKALGKALSQMRGAATYFNSLSKILPQHQEAFGTPLVTQFSDSLVISVDDSSLGKKTLQDALFILTSSLIEHGMLLRGGVVRGEILHDEAMVFGPALITAYQLESEIASMTCPL